MTDIVIHHCKLRVVRQDGWTWGPEPQRLLQSAMRTLPALLARQLAELWEDERDYEIAAPVRITIPVRMSELMAVDMEHTDSDTTLELPPLPALHSRLAQALRLTFLRDHFTPTETAHARATPVADSHELKAQMSPSEPQWSGTLLRLLLSWCEQGVLATRLELCTLPSLEAWYRSLCTTGRPITRRQYRSATRSTPPLAPRLARTLPAPAPHRDAMLRRWLLLAVETAHHLGVLPGDAVVQQALHQVFPLLHTRCRRLPPLRRLSSCMLLARGTPTPWKNHYLRLQIRQ